MIRKASLFCAVLTGLTLTSCGGRSVWTDSTVQGELDVASFPAAPVAVEATNEHGAVTRVNVQSGTFELALERGHKYQLKVVLTSGAEPIVFPRSDGSLAAQGYRGGESRATLGDVFKDKLAGITVKK